MTVLDKAELGTFDGRYELSSMCGFLLSLIKTVKSPAHFFPILFQWLHVS